MAFPLKVIGKVGLDAVKEQGGATWVRAVQAAAQKAKDQVRSGSRGPTTLARLITF
jgi:hypothetical protein